MYRWRLCSGENIEMGNNTMQQKQMLMHSIATVSLSGFVFIIMVLFTILKLICLFKKKWRSQKDFDEQASQILNELTLPATYQPCSIAAETAAIIETGQKSASLENKETASVHGNTELASTTTRFRPSIDTA